MHRLLRGLLISLVVAVNGLGVRAEAKITPVRNAEVVFCSWPTSGYSLIDVNNGVLSANPY